MIDSVWVSGGVGVVLEFDWQLEVSGGVCCCVVCLGVCGVRGGRVGDWSWGLRLTNCFLRCWRSCAMCISRSCCGGVGVLSFLCVSSFGRVVDWGCGLGLTNCFLRIWRSCAMRSLRTCRGDLGDLSVVVVIVVVGGIVVFVDAGVVGVDGEGGRLALLKALLKNDRLIGAERCSRR